jgi:putative Mg2+ transporter-C (MgtC) family protein
MPLSLSWQDVAVRIGLAIAAGALVGFNRQSRGQAAGLRTTILVCLAACLAMVLANLLLDTTGKDPSKFAQIDVLRLPLGILSGIGFIGAGAIVRRGDVVVGVVTAATIWFMTVVGLCIGAGKLLLGVVAAVVAFAVLWALHYVDKRIRRAFRGALTVSAHRNGLAEADLRRHLENAGYHIVAWAITYEDSADRYEAHAELEWRGHESDRGREPEFVKPIANNPAVLRAEWTPAATAG